MKNYVIIYGSLFEGIQGVIGPFDTSDKAKMYQDTHNLEHYKSAVFELKEE